MQGVFLFLKKTNSPPYFYPPYSTLIIKNITLLTKKQGGVNKIIAFFCFPLPQKIYFCPRNSE